MTLRKVRNISDGDDLYYAKLIYVNVLNTVKQETTIGKQKIKKALERFHKNDDAVAFLIDHKELPIPEYIGIDDYGKLVLRWSTYYASTINDIKNIIEKFKTIMQDPMEINFPVKIEFIVEAKTIVATLDDFMHLEFVYDGKELIQDAIINALEKKEK